MAAGIEADYGNPANNVFQQNNCSNNQGEGIFLYETNDQVINNTCSFNGLTDISGDWADTGIDSDSYQIANNIFIQNNCSYNYVNGIFIEEAHDSVINNICLFNGINDSDGEDNGILSAYGPDADNLISQNNCSYDFSDGICLVDSNDLVSNNTCSYNGYNVTW